MERDSSERPTPNRGEGGSARSGDRPSKRRGRRRSYDATKIFAVGLAVALLITAAVVFLIVRYAPTTEKMSLDKYFALTEDDQAAVIVDGRYDDGQDGAILQAVIENGAAYLETSYVNENFDKGYYFDETEGILRYVTDTEVISAALDSPTYTIGRQSQDLSVPVVVKSHDKYFIALDFIKLYTDLDYTTVDKPNRIVIERAGYKKKVAAAKGATEVRRFGGNKSKILSTIRKGDKLTVMEDYGKWSKVMTEDAVIGCVKNRYIGDTKTETTAARLEERNYQHITMDEKVVLLWHQVTNVAANAGVSQVISRSPGVNVLSPTWFSVADSKGGLSSIASLDYVRTAQASGIQVWALFGNVDSADVDMTALLNTTSSRDNLVNNIIANAIAYGLDGVNIDFESLSSAVEGGYREFIRELSIKCKANDLVLSVDNYVPSNFTAFYDRANQADYADYVMIMAYDEHNRNSEEAGSNASISFVKKAVSDTLEEVPAERTVLGMPFYTRIFTKTDTGMTSETLSMAATAQFIADHNLTPTWSDEDGQSSASFATDNGTASVWFEDARSLSLKLQTMKDNGLAGAAFWKSGQENAEIWQTIDQYID